MTHRDEDDRAELVGEIVAWLNRRTGQVLQLHAEAKTDHEHNIVDEHASALEQSAIEIEAEFGGRERTMTQPTDPFMLPYDAAESITLAYLKRQLVWMAEYLEKQPLLEQDRTDVIKDIVAVRRVVFWLTGDFSYDDAAD